MDGNIELRKGKHDGSYRDGNYKRSEGMENETREYEECEGSYFCLLCLLYPQCLEDSRYSKNICGMHK